MNDIEKLFEGTDFSQEFKDKTVAIVESLIVEREESIQEATEEKYKKISEEYAEYVVAEYEEKTEKYIEEELIPTVDKYLNHAIKSFVSENESNLTSSVKVKLAEQLFSGFKSVVENFNVVVPEGQDNCINQLEEKISKVQEEFDNLLDEKNELEKEILNFKKSEIVDAKVKDLTESQKEKFFGVVSKITYKDENQFSNAVDQLYENYFPIDKNSQKLTEELVEFKPDSKTTKNDYLDSLLSKI